MHEQLVTNAQGAELNGSGICFQSVAPLPTPTTITTTLGDRGREVRGGGINTYVYQIQLQTGKFTTFKIIQNVKVCGNARRGHQYIFFFIKYNYRLANLQLSR